MKKLLLALAAFAACNAQASFIDHQSYSTDTITGLEWLDVSATAGLTYAQVAIGVGGFTNDGWRIANGGEVRDLFSRYLLTPPENMTFGLPYLRAEQIITQMGVTMSWNNLQGGTHFTDPSAGNQISLDGFFNDGTGNEMVGLAEITALLSDARSELIAGSRWVAYDNWFTACGNNAGNIGTFLVRATVPEPSSLWLLGASMAGLFGVRRLRSCAIS